MSAYFQQLMHPLEPYLSTPGVTDVYINRPGEVHIEMVGGEGSTHKAGALDEKHLHRLARQIAASSAQGISRNSPILSASLSSGIRVQVVIPPASREWPIFAFRMQAAKELPLSAYEAGGKANAASENGLARLVKCGSEAERLALAVKQKRNILVSGGTSSGKTTFLNSLVAEIPIDERLVLIEDTPEIECRHQNMVGLLASRSALAESSMSPEDLLIASLRLRPDRIILGEVRGSEAFTFLRAVNTGHPGSMTTIHADSCERAVEQLAMLVLQGGSRMRREDIVAYIHSVIDVFVQLERRDGRRVITELRLRDTNSMKFGEPVAAC